MLTSHTAAALAAASCLAAAASPVELTLTQAVDRALAANRGLLVSSFAVEGELASLSLARSEFETKFFPVAALGRTSDPLGGSATAGGTSSIGLEARRKLEWGTSVAIGPSFNRAGSQTNTTLNVSVRQPLLGGFGSDVHLEPTRQSEFAVATARRQHRQAQIDLALAAVAAFHEAVRQERVLELNRELAARLGRHALVSRRKEQLGLASPMDALRAEIRRRDADDGMQLAQTARDAALGRLRVLLALDSESALRLVAPREPGEPDDAMAEDDALLHERPDLRQLEGEVDEARRAVALARRGVLPDLALRVGYGRLGSADPSFGSLGPAAQRQWSIFIEGGGSLDRSAERQKLQRAVLKQASVEAALAERAAESRRQLRQHRRSMEETAARMKLRGEQIRHAEGKLALAELKLAHDMADNFDVIEAETELQRARSDLIAAETEYAIARQTLRAARGQVPR